MRLGFETIYTINVLRRLLTLPVRPHLPAFYIVGFPVSPDLIHTQAVLACPEDKVADFGLLL